MFVIMGATGNTGTIVAERLLARGEKVRVIGRDAGRLARFVQKGAQAFAADQGDAEALARAFDGARAVYAMQPPNMGATDVPAYQEKISDALAAALKKASVSQAVVLSSIGADKPGKTGPVAGLYNLEQKLNAIGGLNAIYLRAGYFMENLLPQVEVIRNFGIVGGPLRADLAVSMIATRDIGAAAATFLQSSFSGKEAHELLGQRDVNYQEVARVIGQAIGKPELAYVQLPAEQLKPALTGMGMSANMADLLLEMAEALNNGYMKALEPRSAQNTTPTSVEAFVAEEFVPRFQGKGATA